MADNWMWNLALQSNKTHDGVSKCTSVLARNLGLRGLANLWVREGEPTIILANGNHGHTTRLGELDNNMSQWNRHADMLANQSHGHTSQLLLIKGWSI